MITKGEQRMAFGKDFLWGAATASAQIEGGHDADGRTPSIWDVSPLGKIKGDVNCHVSCDHYNRWRDDIKLMKKIGLKSYRFSVSWSRVIPEQGKVNEKGLAFYSDLVDELIENGIEPLVTIFHWDLPVWAEKKGGWLNEEIIPLFAEYTRVLVEALSDRVTYWMPMNEPQSFILNGYLAGEHAPYRHRLFSLSKLGRNCLMAFHESAEIIRRTAKKTPKIGAAMASGAYIPKDESEKEIEKARKKSFYSVFGTFGNRFWNDPLVLGKPVRGLIIYAVLRKYVPRIKTELDFIGVNVYSPYRRRWHNAQKHIPEEKKNSLGWYNDGRCIYWTIRFFSERYSLPVMVTENGMCDNDTVADDGGVHDTKRIAFMKEYLSTVKRANDEGYNVTGFQYWSLLDNFEWAEGYAPRFGITYVDYETGERILKDSALFYKETIDANGENL